MTFQIAMNPIVIRYSVFVGESSSSILLSLNSGISLDENEIIPDELGVMDNTGGE